MDVPLFPFFLLAQPIYHVSEDQKRFVDIAALFEPLALHQSLLLTLRTGQVHEVEAGVFNIHDSVRKTFAFQIYCKDRMRT